MRETFGACVALWRAAHARDPQVRRVYQAIAEDECSHAELSCWIARWIATQLDSTTRAELEQAMRAAIDELERDLAGDPEPSLCDVAGVPNAAESRALLEQLRTHVWSAAYA